MEQSKKNIWLICKYASPSKYFLATRHFYLAEEWTKLGYDVTIFTSNSNHLTKVQFLPQFKGKMMVEYIERVRTVWLNTFKASKSTSIKRIISWIHFEWQIFTCNKEIMPKPDIVIVSSLSILSIISGLYYSKKYDSKFILEIRDIWPLSAMRLGNFSKYNPLIVILALIEKLGYSYADIIVGTMPNLNEHIENVLGKRVTNCVCIPQGFSSRFYEKQELLTEKFKNSLIPKNKFIVAYAGTLNKNNPIDILLDVSVELENNPNIHFLILGDGDQKERLTNKYGHNKNITFIDKIKKTQVNDFLKTTDICFDCIDSEIAQFGISRNKWIDYMYAGKPIVCSYSGYQSMINEAGCGSFVAYGDKNLLKDEILKYMNLSPTQLRMIGEKGHDFLIKNRSFNKLALQYTLLF